MFSPLQEPNYRGRARARDCKCLTYTEKAKTMPDRAGTKPQTDMGSAQLKKLGIKTYGYS